MTAHPIKPALFDFLRELKANNERPWFEENKARYRAEVQGPMLDFIQAFAEPLAEISPHFRADPRANGGSLFRIYRDTRFSKDKTPYKTNVGAHFRHEAGKDAHAPGFYLHLEPGMCFAGCGVWHPDSPTLGRIRDAILWSGRRNGRASPPAMPSARPFAWQARPSSARRAATTPTTR